MATEGDVRERAHASQIGWYMQSTTEPERRGWQSTARPLRHACDARGSIAATEVTSSRFNSGRQISKSCTSHLKNGANACARGATPCAGVTRSKAQSSRTVRRNSRGLRGANRLRAIATELRVSRLYAARRTAKAHTALRQPSPASASRIR